MQERSRERLEDFPRIQQVIGIEEVFDLLHPVDGWSVLGPQEFAFNQADAVFTSGGSAKFEGTGSQA
jgi:hypothetical protein